jgi:hypothetical protein
MRGTFTFFMRELAGALGDYGPFLPFAVGYITECGLDPSGFRDFCPASLMPSMT